MGFFKDVDDSSNEDLLAELDSKMEAIDSDELDVDAQMADSLASVDDIDAGTEDADLLSAIESVGEEEAASDTVEVAPEEPAVVDNRSLDEPVLADTQESGSDSNMEVTVITKGTTIKGGISSDCSLEVMGVITGDVECQGKLSVFGSVSGNAIASEIFVKTPVKLEGDLNSTGSVKISEDSVVVGKIVAVSAYIAGAIKGDIEVLGSVVIDSTAVVVGNITAKTLQFNNGAIVEGICTVGEIPADISSKFE